MEIYEPQEDSELMAAAIAKYKGRRALDMGTGSGILYKVLEKSFSEVIGADINPAAKKFVKNFVLSDLFARVEGTFDLVVFNPPYLPGTEDPRWSAGERGEILHRFFDTAPRFLKPNGIIVFLLSSASPIAISEIEAKGFRVRELASKKVAFERLTVYEARRVLTPSP